MKSLVKNLNRKQIAWGALIIFIVMQVFRIDKTNPPIAENKDFVNIVNPTDEIATILKNACYDCHSNHSTYPWYTNIAPVSWWVKGHIKNGRRQVNFSEWGDYDEERRSHALRECIEVMADRRMPLKSYTWAHSEARLSDAQKQRLQDWFESL